jgi:hypothetical protein
MTTSGHCETCGRAIVTLEGDPPYCDACRPAPFYLAATGGYHDLTAADMTRVLDGWRDEQLAAERQQREAHWAAWKGAGKGATAVLTGDPLTDVLVSEPILHPPAEETARGRAKGQEERAE